jgi:uncharacterized protein YjiK
MKFCKTYFLFCLSIFLLTVSFCSSTNDGSHAGKSFPYDLSKPGRRISLPNGLAEVSGIAWYRKDTILCIQDEKARIYVTTLPGGKTAMHFDFWKDGDFEDLAVTGNAIFALRSDGKIFEIHDLFKDASDVTEYKTPLSSKNNTEGLAWDDISKSLLIACKDAASFGNTKPGHKKAIYRFDYESRQFIPEPAYFIDLRNPGDFSSPDIFSSMEDIVKKNNIKTDFRPSGLSVHPLTGEIFVLSGRLLAILNRSGKISNFSFLDPELFRQPEGICFSPAGELYISSEGRGGQGYILEFHATK